MAELGPQRPARPATEAQVRARFFNSANAFDLRHAPVPAKTFVEEAGAALRPEGPTALIDCDQSAAMEIPVPATTPLMRARYARVVGGESLSVDFAATGTICFVIEGSGRSVCTDGAGATEAVEWQAGDVVLFPGACPVEHHAASSGDAVLWLVTDEPLLAAGGLVPDAASCRGIVHYPASEIERQLDLVMGAEPEPDTSGRALIFSTEALEPTRNLHPFLTLSLNTLPPGESQAAHRHNSAAVTLIVEGSECDSVVNGHALPWRRWTTMVTPPGATHSHRNHGTGRARFLIVQDGGLHYLARTMAFESRPDTMA
jgi:gentisate 1,2-dioxygenase